MRTAALLAAVTASMLAAGRAGAEEAELGGILGMLEEERVVSASRFEQDLRESPSSITVVTREQIALSGARTATDLLRLVPGLDVIDMNASYACLSIRGFNDESNTALLVLIDGVKFNLELTGGAIIPTLPVPLQEIERIEVIRGPGSALWGQNAFLGVINIITRDPRDGGQGLLVGRAGQIGSRTGTVRYARDEGPWAWRVFASTDAQDGRVHADEDDRTSFRGGATFVTDAPHEVRVDAMADVTNGTIFSSLGEVSADALQAVLRTSYRHEGLTAQVYWTRTDLGLGLRFPGIIPDLFPGIAHIDGVSDTFDGEVLHEWELGDHHLTVGAGGRLNRFRTEAQVGGGDDEALWDAFAQDTWAITGELQVTGGLRYDGNSITEAAVSPRLALTYNPGEHHTLRLAAGQAFRNPSFIENQIDLAELRAVFPGGTIANPDLENENVRTAEAAYAYTEERRYRFQAAVFYDQIRDFVSFDVFDPTSPTYGRYKQLGDGFDSWGGELSGEWAAADHVQLFGHAAYVRIEENPGDLLVDDEAPTWRALVGVRGEVGRARGQVTAQYVDGRTTEVQDPAVGVLGGLGGKQAFVPVDLPSYVLVNAHVSVRLWDDRLELFASAWNLLDDDIQEFPSMPWDRDGDPATPAESFGGEPNPRQIVAGLSLTF